MEQTNEREEETVNCAFHLSSNDSSSSSSLSPRDLFEEISESLTNISAIAEHEAKRSTPVAQLDSFQSKFRKRGSNVFFHPLRNGNDSFDKDFLQRRQRMSNGAKNTIKITNDEHCEKKLNLTSIDTMIQTPFSNFLQSNEETIEIEKENNISTTALPFIPKKGKPKIELKDIPSHLLIPEL